MRSFTTYLRSFDKFGEPYSINFKGNQSHQTLFGGILSIIAAICTILYGLKKVQKLVLLGDPNITFNQLNHDAQTIANLNAKDHYFDVFIGFDINLDDDQSFDGDFNRIFTVETQKFYATTKQYEDLPEK